MSLAMLTSYVRAPVQIPVAPSQFQLPADKIGKAAEENPNA